VNKLILNSYAKLNIYLEVLNKHKDNYHSIQTIFERIDLCDKILLRPRPDKKIKILCKDRWVPKDETNLCYRSAKLLKDKFSIDRGLDIGIIKRIPVSAGLGGGSSNAASVFLGLNKLWKLRLSKNRLATLAKVIGCDIPFFLYDVPFAQGTMRGDRIKPLKILETVKLWHILVVPKLQVSTPIIYKKWDNARKAGLTRPQYNVRILTSALRKKDFSSIGRLLYNSLERIIIRLYPEVSLIKEMLGKLGVKSILMSGSGPAVFGIVSSRKEAVSISRELSKYNKPWRVFLTRTV
jgi:4-diphosphocytidyl-2-C-methyl-D-erythritol kinase